MSNMQIFAAYAGAFEETLVDDNWDRLRQYFNEDACCLPGDGSEANGRDAVIQALQDSVDSLERQADSRELLGEPDISESGDTITLKYSLRYTKSGRPDLVLNGVETILYANGGIQRMEDVFEDPDALMAWRDQN